MAIGANSRYRDSVLQAVTGPDGSSRQEIRVPFPTSRVVSYTFYRLKSGDRVDELAERAFGNPEFWHLIALANPEILDWSADLIGTVVRIPNG